MIDWLLAEVLTDSPGTTPPADLDLILQFRTQATESRFANIQLEGAPEKLLI